MYNKEYSVDQEISFTNKTKGGLETYFENIGETDFEALLPSKMKNKNINKKYDQIEKLVLERAQRNLPPDEFLDYQKKLKAVRKEKSELLPGAPVSKLLIK